MKSSQKVIAIGLTLFISACGDPNEIDFMKDTYIDGCDTATVGDMLALVEEDYRRKGGERWTG